MGAVIAALAALAGLAVVWFAGVRRLLRRGRRVATARIVDPDEHTTMRPDGSVHSVQAADLTMDEDGLASIWSPTHLERLARTYWRFLTRATLGLMRVKYSDDGRQVVFLARPFALLTFRAPEYRMNADRGIVRWRIERGVLVSRAGRDQGYLEIDVQRCPCDEPGRARVHVEVEVANFYPSLASGIASWFYIYTQSRIHVIVTHAFLRSLARMDLAESRVGRFAAIEDVPDPESGRPLPSAAGRERHAA
ncbi:MAG TPA: hypothetical protein VGV40_06515 [Solirubrobacteraceae bacterium]|nr:hypothetical protein [Solirubrobacteraceae bacterium]